MTDSPAVELTAEQQLAASLISKARELHAERERNTKQTALNRDMLRGLAGQDMLTAEQSAAVTDIYPLPKRKPKDAAEKPADDAAKQDAEKPADDAAAKPAAAAAPKTPPAAAKPQAKPQASGAPARR